MMRGLLANQAELARLRECIGRKPFDHIYEALQKRCALILESAPITEATWRGAYQQGRWGAATAAAGSIQGRLFDLIVCHHIDRNGAYRDRAIEELKNIVGFTTWVDPSHTEQQADLCTGEACAAVAVALDWLHDDLHEADRIRCARALREKGLTPYLKAVEAGAFWYNCYHNWNAVINSGVGLAGLLLQDEEDCAARAVVKAKAGLKCFFDALGREGGWDEGLGYWGYAMRYVLMFGQALSNVSHDQGVFRQRGMDATGLFPVYFTPHGVPVSFGDRPLTPAWGMFYVLVAHYGLREVAWWLDRYAFRRDVTTTGYSDAGLALLFRPVDWEQLPHPQLAPVKAFNEIGWVAVADHWPAPTLYAALKTGDLSAHHAQLDMNSVQIMHQGEILLHDTGSPEFTREYLSPEGRYGFYEVQARAHNTLTLAEREHRLDAIGSIVEAQDADTFRWAAGDAGVALGEDVRFIRHVVMPIAEETGDGLMVVVLDELHNPVAEKVSATWHTGGEITLDAARKTGKIAGLSASLHVGFAASCEFSVAQSHLALGQMQRKVDNVITLSAPAKADVLLVSVFAPGPVGKIKVKLSTRGDVDLAVGAVKLHWKASRKNLRLETVHI
jgi:hypothetical protein